MRTRLAPLAALLLTFAAVAAACGSSTPATVDPYKVVSDASKTEWSPVQVNIGASVKSGSTTVTLDPSALAAVIDSKAGTGAVHISLPVASLGIDAATLTQLGVTGSTLDVDVVYDGTALYGKSPVFASLVTLLFAQSGGLPSGDLTGWLRFGTKDDFAGLLAGASAAPSFAAPSAGDAAGLKTLLTDEGVTLTAVGTEQHNGADAYHLTAAIDNAKLLASHIFDSVNRSQIDTMATTLQELTISADLWVDKSSNHLTEVDAHVVSTKDSTQKADLTLTFKDPDGSVSTAAPSSSVDIPIKTLVQNLMTLIGQGLTGA